MKTKDLLKESLSKVDIEVNDLQIEKFELFKKELIEWNEKINLTTIVEDEEIVVKHFIDSIIVKNYINDTDSIIDVGTGAGFPGIPLKIMMDSIKVTLLDSLNKRVEYLKNCTNILGLKNIESIHFRAEEAGQNEKYREKYDVAISRAVANMTALAEYMIPFVKIGGRVICMKGPNVKEELEESIYAIEKLGGKILNVVEYELPNTDIQRTIIIIEKIAKTPKQFPRKAGKPMKEPIVKK